MYKNEAISCGPRNYVCGRMYVKKQMKIKTADTWFGLNKTVRQQFQQLEILSAVPSNIFQH